MTERPRAVVDEAAAQGIPLAIAVVINGTVIN
jgi:hypothetical protein